MTKNRFLIEPNSCRKKKDPACVNMFSDQNCVPHRECPHFCNPMDDMDEENLSSPDFPCKGNVTLEAMHKRLQTILKNNGYVPGCRGEQILECVDLCKGDDRDARLTRLYERYNEKHQHDRDIKKAKLIALSQPKPRPSPEPEKKAPFQVKTSALTYTPTKRILKLTQVDPRKLTEKYRPPSVPKYSAKELKNRQLKWHALLRTFPPRPSPKNKKKKKTKSKRKKSAKVKKHNQTLEEREKLLNAMYTRLAQPKKEHKDPTPERRGKPHSHIMKRIEELLALAKPPEPKIDINEFYKPKLPPKGYKPSPRLLELAKPKKVPSEYLLNLNYHWTIKPAVLNYKPTERILRLAIPKERKDPEPDFDPDAFKVKESALRYKASKRIKRLAKPKVYAEID